MGSWGGRVALVVAGVCVVGLMLWSAAPRRAAPPTSYSAGSHGLLALYRLLVRDGVPVGRVTGPSLPDSGTLVAAAGRAAVPFGAAMRLVAWVHAGHTAVVLGSVPALERELGVLVTVVPFAGSEARAVVPLPQLRGAGEIALPDGLGLLAPAGAVVLYARGAAPAAFRLTEGRGTILWFGSAGLWANSTLARYPGNVALAESLLDRGRPVWFDEYWFGAGRAQAARVRAAGRSGLPLPLPAGWPVAAAALAAAAAVALWSAGWRRHPIRPAEAPAPTAREALVARSELRFQTEARGNRDAG